MLPPQKAPLCKGGWIFAKQKDWGIVLYRPITIPTSRLAPCHPQAPFVCFADIFPANGEIYPLHKGGFRAVNDRPYENIAPLCFDVGIGPYDRNL